MTDIDEKLFSAAKLREQIDGRLDSDSDIHPHGGIVDDDEHRSHLSFVESIVQSSELSSFANTKLGDDVLTKFRTDRATRAVSENDMAVISHLVGVTEQDLDASVLSLPLRIDDELDNYDATAFVAGCGNPNTGKTNLMALLAEIRTATTEDLLVLSNIRTWDRTDVLVTSAHDLAVAALKHRSKPKFVVVDEGSTHLDARTNSREVATQFTPLAKRFAKINVDVFGTIGHTGKDLHPEVKRLTTLAYFKTDQKTVDFYDHWDADSDMPDDRLFGGTLENLEPATSEPDPDDAAPWNWNLEPDLFSLDLGWDDLLEELQQRGPAN